MRARPETLDDVLTIVRPALRLQFDAYQQAGGGTTSVTETGLLFSPLLGGGTTTFTVTNTSGSAIAGPIQLVLSGLAAGVTAANNTGTFNGNPYWRVTAGSLGPSAPVSVTVQLNYASSTAVSVMPTVYSGNL